MTRDLGSMASYEGLFKFLVGYYDKKYGTEDLFYPKPHEKGEFNFSLSIRISIQYTNQAFHKVVIPSANISVDNSWFKMHFCKN